MNIEKENSYNLLISDEVISKHLKESILQTCPDINDAGIKSEILVEKFWLPNK